MNRTLPDPHSVMTVKELSAYLKVHPSTIYRLLKLGQLPAFKVGSVNAEAFARWCFELEKKRGP